jgi:hypothetical protein
LTKKLEQLNDLLKAIKKLNPPTGPTLPKLPGASPPPPPPMKAAIGQAPKISNGEGPNSKKDPKKVAEQIKNGSMTTKTQKVMLKADSKTGQWYLEPTDGADV